MFLSDLFVLHAQIRRRQSNKDESAPKAGERGERERVRTSPPPQVFLSLLIEKRPFYSPAARKRLEAKNRNVNCARAAVHINDALLNERLIASGAFSCKILGPKERALDRNRRSNRAWIAAG